MVKFEIKINQMGPLRFELKSIAPETLMDSISTPVEHCNLDEFIAFREIEGLNDSWIYHIRHFINDYLDYTHWIIDKKKTLDYLNNIRRKHSTTYFRKITYQIRKFLVYLHIDWAKDINPPSEPQYIPKRLSLKDIKATLTYFAENKFYLQLKAIILLGASSGLRAEELYQLNLDDIDLDNRTIYVNHNPINGQTTKTKLSRVTFIDRVTKQTVKEFHSFYVDSRLRCLFNQYHIERLFRDAPIKVKDLRKYFSQEWDRRGGPTSIKKILMGHSLKGDVDLMHYNAQSPEDLKKIYDKVMNKKQSFL